MTIADSIFKQMGFYASLLLLAGTVGDIFGGCVSDFWAKWSDDLKKARRLVGAAGFLVSAVCMVPACLTTNPMTSCLALLRGDLCAGVDGGCFLGHHARHRRRFRGFGFVGHEYLRQPWRRYRLRIVGLSCRALWMERAVPGDGGLSVVGTVLYLRINASQRLQTS